MIRQLLPGWALVIRGGCSPVLVRLPMGWKDLRYRAARHNGEAIARLAPVSDPELELHDDELDALFGQAGFIESNNYPWDEETE
jgi:hypothetical protein